MSTAKSKVALEYNIELLSRTCDDAHRFCFWTFTLPLKLYPVEGARMWGDLCRELRRSLGFYGVRVFELHPSGHGLHVHVCTSRFFDVRQVRSICERKGWGRLNVEMIPSSDVGHAVRYMSKYLTKQSTVLWKGFLKGVRWWATFGKCPDLDRVRVKDVKSSGFWRSLWDMMPNWIVMLVCSVQYPLHSDDVRHFNLAKMWLSNKVYSLDRIALEIVHGFDFDLLRRGAWFMSQEQPYPVGGFQR